MNLAGPFLTMNFEFDQYHGPSPGPSLTIVEGDMVADWHDSLLA